MSHEPISLLMECSLFNEPAMSHTAAANRRVVYSMNSVTLNCVLLLDKPNTSLNKYFLVGGVAQW